VGVIEGLAVIVGITDGFLLRAAVGTRLVVAKADTALAEVKKSFNFLLASWETS